MDTHKINRGGPAFLRTLPGRIFQGWITASATLVLLFIAVPLLTTLTAPTWEILLGTLADPDVLRSVWLSMSTSAMAAGIAFVFGTPLAYVLARNDFPGKKVVESLVDLPIMIPHPVVGIALLSLTSPNVWFGQFLESMGIEIMGTKTGIVAVLVFVGLPFYINTAKSGIEAIPPRLEKVSRSLGAGVAATFFRITLPLCWRSMLVGMIMCMARAISEFGAIIIVSYHPMIAPVLMYERFTAFGLKYSQPVAVILIVVSMLFFLLLRTLSLPREKTT